MAAMVELVARTLAMRHLIKNPDAVPSGTTPYNALQEIWVGFVDDAVAAVAAMREPTAAMAAAAEFGPLTTSHGDEQTTFEYLSANDAAACWRTMIDEALRER